MSWDIDSAWLSSDFNSLKARVKAEMLRRNGYGDMSSYGGVSYDYTIVPAPDVELTTEHYNKILDPQIAINPSGVPLHKNINDEQITLSVAQAKQTLLEAQPRGSVSNNDCASACSGMCISQCTTSCSGCTSCTSCTGCTGCSSCSGTCTVICGGNCTGTCTNTCATGCATTCGTICYGTCGGSCGGFA